MAKYSIDEVVAHIKFNHPGCPEFAVNFFAAEVARSSWKRATLGKAVGITLQNYLRHNLTDYDQLLLSGISRREARRRVQPRVNAMIQSWSKVKAETKASATKAGSLHDIGDENDG